MPEIGKFLIIAGIAMALLGCVLLVVGKIPGLGRLPGDINVVHKNFSFHFPIVTCIIVSVILSILLNFFTRNR